MKLLLGILSALCAVLICAACNSPGPVHPVPPTSRNFSVVSSTPGSARVWLSRGIAAGSTVTASNGGSGSGIAAANGSVKFDITVSGTTVDLTYETTAPGTGEATLTETFPVRLQSDLVTKPYFATGSAPNDFIQIGASFAVANSLDNTVTLHRFDGAVLDTEGLPQFSSPSYLTFGILSQPELFVVCNGDNTVHRYAIDFAGDNNMSLSATGNTLSLSNPAGAAFVGPGDPLVTDGWLFVPRSEILSFSPTVYGTGKLSAFNLETGEESLIELSGVNAVTAQNWDSPGGRRVLVLSAGELQFDENFTPQLESDSYLDIFEITAAGPELLETYNLGKIGAARIVPINLSFGNIAYIGNLVSGQIYKVNLDSGAMLRGVQNPIQLTEEFTYISDLKLIPDSSHLACLSFNTDELFVLDFHTDELYPRAYPGPFDLSLDAQLLAGANSLEMSATNPPHAYVLSGVANSVTRVMLLEPFIPPDNPGVI